jgi:hypothetical protein
MVYAVGGFGIMALTAAAMAVVPLGLAVWWQMRGRLGNVVCDKGVNQKIGGGSISIHKE